MGFSESLEVSTCYDGNCSASYENSSSLLSQKFMGKSDSKIAQEATADSILFASSPQPIPLRHHFPFLEMWQLIHSIYIFS